MFLLPPFLLAFFTLVSAGERNAQVPLAANSISDAPLLGFGTWNLDKSNASDVVSRALQAGYRHIDCAVAYGNQEAVGKGIKEGAEKAGLKRSDFWVTSKLWNDHHKPSLVPVALNETLTQLGLDYLDLYLMHWPVASEDGKKFIEFEDTWKAMSLLLATGLVKHIGICNFAPDQLHTLMSSITGKLSPPYMHQMELHPYLPQDNFLGWHEAHDIRVTAYSPLGNMNPTYSSSRKQAVGADVPQLLDNKVLQEIAEARGCTPAQVALKWGMSRGTSVIPKSAHASRIEENFKSTACNLKKEDFEKLKQLPTKRFNNPSKSWGVTLFEDLDDAATTSADTTFLRGFLNFLDKMVVGLRSDAKSLEDV